MIVADASWLIALVDPTDPHHGLAKDLEGRTFGTRVLLHPLTLAECLVGPARLGKLDQAESALRSAVEVIEFDPASPGRFARLRAETGLRLPDTVVLDTALRHGAGIATFDDRLRAEARHRGVPIN